MKGEEMSKRNLARVFCLVHTDASGSSRQHMTQLITSVTVISLINGDILKTILIKVEKWDRLSRGILVHRPNRELQIKWDSLENILALSYQKPSTPEAYRLIEGITEQLHVKADSSPAFLSSLHFYSVFHHKTEKKEKERLWQSWNEEEKLALNPLPWLMCPFACLPSVFIT